MKCVLASLGFINEDLSYNKQIIIKTMRKYANIVDVIIFGEAFLQGFYGINFDIEHDKKIAININSYLINEICETAKECKICISFGFIEKDNDDFYSSQITIDATGKIIDLYRRVSPGWKEKFASKEYKEGDNFKTFNLLGKKVLIGTCGDLWYDDNIDKINKLEPDILFWPVYTDFNYMKWNESVKYEYAEQTKKIGCPILYVNSYCLDKNEEEIAKGGAVYFENGKIKNEIPSGNESVLIIDC